MSQHVRMYWERKLSRSASSLDHSQEPRCCNWRASFGGEHIRTAALKWSQGPKLRPMQRMHAFNSALSSIHMQSAIPEIDLRPSQRAEFTSSEPMPICQ